MRAEKACCVIGYLTDKEKSLLDNDSADFARLKNNLRYEMIQLIVKASVNHFIISMELGIGLAAAEAVLELRGVHTNITLECVLPYEKVLNDWTMEKREMYHKILGVCDRRTLLNRDKFMDSIADCNDFLMERSKFMIAVGYGASKDMKKLINDAVLRHKVVSVIDLNHKEYDISSRVQYFEMN